MYIKYSAGKQYCKSLYIDVYVTWLDIKLQCVFYVTTSAFGTNLCSTKTSFLIKQFSLLKQKCLWKYTTNDYLSLQINGKWLYIGRCDYMSPAVKISHLEVYQSKVTKSVSDYGQFDLR